MRRLINYFRQCFCKHDWDISEGVVQSGGVNWNNDANFKYDVWNLSRGITISMTCKKCGWVRRFWKYLID